MRYVIFIIFCVLGSNLRAQDIKGKVVDARSRLGIAGAVVKDLQNRIATSTDSDGYFTIRLPRGSQAIYISHIGYIEAERAVNVPTDTALLIGMEAKQETLKEVQYVYTGYQKLSLANSTGSVDVLNRELLQRSVGSNILDRIEYLTPGLIANRVAPEAGKLNLVIRGRSTINGDADPLIVLDNFPYDGNINAINPEDIEQITILKDAASAAIWGAKAGNGVIVITTKKGNKNSKPNFSFSSTFNLGLKTLDLFQQPRMSVADYIAIQTRLFDEGFYLNTEQNDLKNISHAALPGLVELLILKRDNHISVQELRNSVQQLKGYDIRKDIHRYMRQDYLGQQYAMNVTGGSASTSYYFSAGYDKDRKIAIGDGSTRFSLNGNHNWELFDRKLNWSIGVQMADNKSENNGITLSGYEPYDRLVDEEGKALPFNSYRKGFIEESSKKGFLDWNYVPLDEMGRSDNSSKTNDVRLNSSLKVKVLRGLSASLMYQYYSSNGTVVLLNGENSYQARNTINNFTQVLPSGELSYIVPRGGVMSRTSNDARGHNLRGQLDLNETIGQGQFTAMAGYELKKYDHSSNRNMVYGYDQEHATNGLVDFVNQYPIYSRPASRQSISSNASQNYLAERFISWYANANYSYQNKYTFFTSARLDRSNIFGVNTNQKGVPLFAFGANWLMSGEDFFKVNWVNRLSLKASYGHSGNVDKTLSAFTTAEYFAANRFAANSIAKLPFATIKNPPNPQLRWEKIKSINLGVNFEILSNRINGSLEYYNKKGIDLIGETPLPVSTGVAAFKGNYANTAVQGFDINLNLRPMRGKIKWDADLLLSYNYEEVTNYAKEFTGREYLSDFRLPYKGRPILSLYALPWAGLDPLNGDPIGLLNGDQSKDYNMILASAKKDDLIYMGRMSPSYFGSFRNSFTWRSLSMSVNVSYRMGHVFRRTSIIYGGTYGLENGHADYSLRWRVPGDELNTIVPSVPVSPNNQRDYFYGTIPQLIEKGDEIRLQDIRFAVDLSKNSPLAKSIGQGELFMYVNNIAILYTATSHSIDPGYLRINKPPLSFAFGFRVNFK